MNFLQGMYCVCDVFPYSVEQTCKCWMCEWMIVNSYFSVHFYPTCVLILKPLSTVGHSTVHVHDVVTDWSYALAEFLVSSLFRAFPFPGNPSNVHIANVF